MEEIRNSVAGLRAYIARPATQLGIIGLLLIGISWRILVTWGPSFQSMLH